MFWPTWLAYFTTAPSLMLSLFRRGSVFPVFLWKRLLSFGEAYFRKGPLTRPLALDISTWISTECFFRWVVMNRDSSRLVLPENARTLQNDTERGDSGTTKEFLNCLKRGCSSSLFDRCPFGGASIFTVLDVSWSGSIYTTCAVGISTRNAELAVICCTS